jgi:hypothetical protein
MSKLWAMQSKNINLVFGLAWAPKNLFLEVSILYTLLLTSTPTWTFLSK